MSRKTKESRKKDRLVQVFWITTLKGYLYKKNRLP